jgi:hypothetical protein
VQTCLQRKHENQKNVKKSFSPALLLQKRGKNPTIFANALAKMPT